ncbi:MAG: hypothetical protein K1X74_08335 [Pirellulales bacterium]|nr:hypothetical protein [Pirellulales bacterium]
MADLYYKSFSYRVLSARVDEYLAIRHQADQLYRRYFDRLPTYLQSTADPYQWLELYAYEDPGTYRMCVERLQADPEMDRLWRRFRTVLDPTYPAKFEEFRVAAGAEQTQSLYAPSFAAGPVAAPVVEPVRPEPSGPAAPIIMSAAVPAAETVVEPPVAAPIALPPAAPEAQPPQADATSSVAEESLDAFSGESAEIELPEAATVVEYGESSLTIADVPPDEPTVAEAAPAEPEFGFADEPAASFEQPALADEPASSETFDLDFETGGTTVAGAPEPVASVAGIVPEDDIAAESGDLPEDNDFGSGDMLELPPLDAAAAEDDFSLPELAEFEAAEVDGLGGQTPQPELNAIDDLNAVDSIEGNDSLSKVRLSTPTENISSEPTLLMPEPPPALLPFPQSLTPPQPVRDEVLPPPVEPPAATTPPTRGRSGVETLYIPTQIDLPPLGASPWGPSAKQHPEEPRPPVVPPKLPAAGAEGVGGFEPVEWDEISLDSFGGSLPSNGATPANGRAHDAHATNGAAADHERAAELEPMSLDPADAEFELPDFDLPSDDSRG